MMVVRTQLNTAIRDAAERDDRRRLCTLRLIQTAIRDRDHAHCLGNGEKISQPEIANLLGTMIKQREEKHGAAIGAADNTKAAEAAREISIIREFMPEVMDEPTMRSACMEVMKEIGAAGLRDVGRTVTALKARYPGQIDISRASCMVKGMLR